MSGLNATQVELFDREGFVVVPGVFSPDEVAVLLESVEEGARFSGHESTVEDASGRKSKLALWTDVQQDVFGAVSTSPRLVDGARILLREDVYHWHSKIMLKEPGSGGAWEWHQDYGYWYGDGCPYPRMLSAMVAIDHATRENGCLKMLVGSHQLGRLDHGTVGEQTGISADRLRALEPLFEERYLEAEPGSVVFFHCNTLHASEANLSARPRRAYICAYNAFSNVPVLGDGHGKPVPIIPSAADALVRAPTPAQSSGGAPTPH
jgi:hypothetical protein